MARTWPAWIVAATLIVSLTLSACSGAPSTDPSQTNPTKAAPDPDLVEWLDYVCAADKRFQELAYTNVPINSDPPHPQVLEFVTTIRKGIQTLIGLFQEIDPAPIPGGDTVVTAYVSALTKILPEIQKQESGPVVFVEGVNLTLLYVQTNLITLAPQGADLPTLIADSTELQRAFQQTPVCQAPPAPLTARAPAPPTS